MKLRHILRVIGVGIWSFLLSFLLGATVARAEVTAGLGFGSGDQQAEAGISRQKRDSTSFSGGYLKDPHEILLEYRIFKGTSSGNQTFRIENEHKELWLLARWKSATKWNYFRAFAEAGVGAYQQAVKTTLQTSDGSSSAEDSRQAFNGMNIGAGMILSRVQGPRLILGVRPQWRSNANMEGFEYYWQVGYVF